MEQLRCTASRDNRALAEVLLDAGADPAAVDERGRMPGEYAGPQAEGLFGG